MHPIRAPLSLLALFGLAASIALGCAPVAVAVLVPASLTCQQSDLACEPGPAYEALERGESVRLVGYGASVTSGGAWLSFVESGLEVRTPGDLVIVNAAESARWSGWGVDMLDERVLSMEPDMVFLEFAMNDAYLPFATSLDEARASWIDIIERIHASRPGAQVVLMTMNPVTGKHAAARPEIHAYYEMVRQLSAELGLALIDGEPIWAEILERDPALFQELVPDGIHPRAHAHCLITSSLVIGMMRGCLPDPETMAEAILAGATSACCGS